MTNASEKYLHAVTWCGKLHDYINEKFFDNALNKPVITVAPCEKNKALGWFVCKEVWKESAEDKGNTEINISSNFLNRSPLDIAETMLHEMCHAYAYENKMQDCSRGGTYHNKLYAKIAESRGLNVEKVPTSGYAKTALTDESKKVLKQFVTNEKLIYRLPLAKGIKVKSTSTRKYECSCCGQSVRATKAVNIRCDDCDEIMKEVE